MDTPKNRPGLATLDYRVGTQPEFLARLTWGLPRVRVRDAETGVETRPLAALRQRVTSDPTIALLDGFAVTLDVLAFYSERIANEGFLGTATERRSLVELARAIGYRAAPGVAASVQLALRVESADDPYRVIDVPAGLQAMSVPQAKGELPQLFETVEPVTVRAEWNAIPARTEHDQVLALYKGPGDDDGALFLFDLDNSFDDAALADGDLRRIGNVAGLRAFYPVVEGVDLAGELARLQADAALNDEIVPELRALPVDEVWLRGTGLGVVPSARLAVIGVRREADGSDAVATAVLHAVAAEVELALGVTRLVVRRPGAVGAAVRRPPMRRAARLKRIAPPAVRVAFTGANVGTFVRTATWSGAGLSAFVRTQNWPRARLLAAIRRPNAVVAPETSAARPGLQLMRDEAAFFGATAVRQETLAKATEARGADPYPLSWDDRSGAQNARPIWVDSQGRAHADADALLEREVKAIVPDSWAIIEARGAPPLVLRVGGVNHRAQVDYALSAKASALLFNRADGSDFTAPAGREYLTRASKLHGVSQALVMAGTPIREAIEPGALSIDLDALYLDIEAGRAVSIAGERVDLPGMQGAETLIVEDVIHIGGHTRLQLGTAPVFGYRRATVRINANTVRATHGERFEQALGSGDAAAAHQRFKLAKVPLTYVSAANAVGRASTLEVRVDAVLWREVESLADAGADEAVYAVRTEEDGTSWVMFGDGMQGRRLPTGQGNVTASYRAGIGRAGEVAADSIIQLRTRLLGLAGVGNPAAAGGSAEPEDEGTIRRNAPRSVRTLGRIVSLQDHQDFAETFPGIGKARIDALWSGSEQVAHLSVAPETDSLMEAAAPVLLTLAEAMAGVREGRAPLVVSPAARRWFQLAARIGHHADHLPDVVAADVETAVLLAFGYAARRLAQPVSAAEVIAAMQGVRGVVGIDLDALALVTNEVADAAPTLATVLPALPGRMAGGVMLPAELLTLLPSGIALTMEVARA